MLGDCDIPSALIVWETADHSSPDASSRVQEGPQRTDTGRGDPGVTPARDDPDELDPRLLIRRELIPLARGRGGKGEDDLVHGVLPRHRNWPRGPGGTSGFSEG
jgi:hypothetical protein